MPAAKILLPFFMMTLLLCLSQCTTEGCTDETSYLYNEKADEDNGICRYKTRFVFWWRQPTADFLLEAGENQLFFYISGDSVGMENARNFNETAPACNLNMPYSGEFDMGADAQGRYFYLVTDEEGNEFFNGAIKVDNPQDCNAVELDWFEE